MNRTSFGGVFGRWTAALILAVAAVFGLASAAQAGGKDHYAEVKQELVHDAALRQDFPRLGDKFAVIGDATGRYNCIAWSLGETDHWVNPVTGPSYAPLSGMDHMYAEQGYYREHNLDWRPEPGLEKVVLYATLNLDGTIHEVTHAAHEEADGTFTSKLGGLPIIRHDTPEALRGPTYGVPVAVYVRPIDGNAK